MTTDVQVGDLSIRVWLVANGGGFDALAADLPGTVSYGRSKDEALENIKDAVEMTLDACDRLNIANPWEALPRPDESFSEHRVFVRRTS